MELIVSSGAVDGPSNPASPTVEKHESFDATVFETETCDCQKQMAGPGFPQVFSDAGHEMDHIIAISAGTPMAAPAGETGAWRGRSGRLTSSCPNTPWRPSRPSRCRIAQDFKKVRHGEPNDQGNPAAAEKL